MREPGQAVSAAPYAPRHPETTILYGVVQDHLETWLAHARIQERAVPGFVERELRAFLDCGILANGFLRVFVRPVFASLRRRSRPTRSGAGPAHCGAVTFVERFGGALNLNVHFHTLVLDGAYRSPEGDRALRFHPAPPPTVEELERVLNRVVRGIARAIERRGLGDEPDPLAGSLVVSVCAESKCTDGYTLF